jgi:hypothetical protein
MADQDPRRLRRIPALPLAAAAAAIGEANVPRLFGEMVRYTRPDGIVIDMLLAPSAGEIVTDRPESIKARREALDPGQLDASDRLGLAAYRAAAAIDPRLRLMLALEQPAGPPDWADIALLPPSDDVGQMTALADRLRAQGWLQPDVAGRVALSLPADRDPQIEGQRNAQRQGASAFALCPETPALPPPATLSATFSAASFPYKP